MKICYLAALPNELQLLVAMKNRWNSIKRYARHFCVNFFSGSVIDKTALNYLIQIIAITISIRKKSAWHWQCSTKLHKEHKVSLYADDALFYILGECYTTLVILAPVGHQMFSTQSSSVHKCCMQIGAYATYFWKANIVAV